jgi:hypothetical protein
MPDGGEGVRRNMDLFDVGTRVILKASHLEIRGTVVSHVDDGDTQIANIEEFLTIRTDAGMLYTFQGHDDCLRPRAKTLRKYGRFYAKKDLTPIVAGNN